MQVNNDILQAQDVPAQAPATGRPLNHKLQKINPHAFFKGVMVGTANVVQAIVRYAPSGKLNRHTWSSPGQDFADFAVSQISDKQPAYFSMASFDSASVSEWKGRTEVNIKYLRGFWIDIEGSAEKYAKPDGPENGYPDIAAVKLAVLAWVNKTGLTPCFVVVTGSGGMHLHFVLGAALTTDEWLPRAKALGAMAQTNGLKIDGQVTTDAARIMRAPGSIHQGTGNLVKAYSWRQEPYTLAEFDALTGGTGNTTKPFPQPLTKQHGTNDIIGDALHAPYSYSKAAESCPAMRKAGENNGRDTPYPVWILVLKAAELSVEGREYAHSISSGHADYDQADTDKKMDSLTGGPAGCAAWESAYGLNGPCSTCQYQGRTKNPAVQLGGTSATGQPGASQIEALPTSSSDLALANIFVLLNATAMKYDHAVKKWRQYSDGSWRVCTLGEPVECVKKCAPFVLNMAATAIAGDPDSAKGKKLQSLAMRAQSEKGIGSALRLAESDPRMAVRFEMFDTDPDLLNVANGVVHLPSGQFLPHDPALRLAKQCPIAYNAGAQCPVFLLFMEQISCGDPDWIDYMQRQLGYALSGRVHEEKMFFWFGNGRNGKSVLANILRHIMGDYAVIAPVAMFMVSHRDGADATPQLAMLPGRRLMLANETEAGARLSAQMLKVAVSTEHISARALHGNPFSFAPTHKAIMRGNHLPIIQEGDEGTWRRIDLVPFDLKLTPAQCDPDLESKLIAEAPGILRWLVEGHIKWRARGLTPAVRVRNASNTYRQNSDVIANWITDDCQVGPGLEVEKARAYARYRTWALGEGLRCMAKKSLTRALTERGYGEGRQATGARHEVYRGFRCK